VKVGLIAMSGVRVADPELVEVGLTLPGFVERSQVIASLPSLALLTLAALTPRDVEVDYREVADLEAADALPGDYDLVAISTYSAQVKEAYRLADRFVSRGIPVVIGGPHVTALPEEARARGIVPAVGEGERVWPAILDDLRRGRLQPEYRAPANGGFDLARSPMPRYELLDVERYNRLTVQTSRGCPHHCEFCAGSLLLTRGYHLKPVEKVMAEIRRIQELWAQPFIELADDNSFAQREHAKALLAALGRADLRWFTEADVSVAREPALLDLMRDSGCRQLLIGLESPTPSGLDGLELNSNWKLRQWSRYERAIETIQSRGITVNGCFVLGLDGHTPEVFDQVYDFVERTNLYEVQVTVLTPFPGTPLYRRLQAERRLLSEDAWEKCTLFDVNFEPRGMSAEELRQGLIRLMRRLYEPGFVKRRKTHFFQQLRGAVARSRRIEEIDHET
jgi:radical SAM superfamily enzyme YgiQ (UPF0313 family)